MVRETLACPLRGGAHIESEAIGLFGDESMEAREMHAAYQSAITLPYSRETKICTAPILVGHANTTALTSGSLLSPDVCHTDKGSRSV